MSLTIHEPSPLIVVCSECGKRHEQAIHSTIPQLLNFCSHDCLKSWTAKACGV